MTDREPPSGSLTGEAAFGSRPPPKLKGHAGASGEPELITVEEPWDGFVYHYRGAEIRAALEQ